MSPPFDSSVTGVLEEVSTSGLIGSCSCRLRVPSTGTTPTNISIALRLDPAAEIAACGMRIILQAGISQWPQICVAMSLGVLLDGRYLHGLIRTARHGAGSLRPGTPVTSSANKFTGLQPVKNMFEAVVPLKAATRTPSQQVGRCLGKLFKQGKATLRVKLMEVIETPRRPRASSKRSGLAAPFHTANLHPSTSFSLNSTNGLPFEPLTPRARPCRHFVSKSD